MAKKRPPLLEATFVAVHALGIGLSLPLLSAYRISGWPPRLTPRWSHAEVATPDLGFAWSADAVTAGSRQSEGFADLMGVSLALALVVLLIACSTITVLMLRRGWERRDEFAVRTAVGATRREVRREVTRDWVQLSLVGSFLGVGLGVALESWLRGLAPGILAEPASRFTVLSFASVAAPAFAVATAGAIEATSALRRMKAPFSFDPISRLLQLALSAGYVAALMTLLSVSLHLLRGAQSVDVVSAEWDGARDTLVLDVAGVSGSVALDAVSELNDGERVAGQVEDGLPSSWFVASPGAFEDLGVAEPVLARGTPGAPVVRMLAQHHSVSPGSFASVGVPVTSGREFRIEDDADAPLVAMIDSRLVSRFQGADPVGWQIRIGYVSGPGTWVEIIGVVAARDGAGLAHRQRPVGALYLPALQHPPTAQQLLVRDGVSDPEAAIAAFTAAVPGAVVSDATSLAARWTRSVAPFRWFASLATLLAFGTAAIGITGLITTIALEVRSRIPELGVRRAVGARRRHLRALVLRDLGRILIWGFALGSSASAGFVRGFVDRFSFLGAYEPMTPLIVGVVIGLAAIAAVMAPLRRAGRITPIDAMGSTD